MSEIIHMKKYITFSTWITKNNSKDKNVLWSQKAQYRAVQNTVHYKESVLQWIASSE